MYEYKFCGSISECHTFFYRVESLRTLKEIIFCPGPPVRKTLNIAEQNVVFTLAFVQL